MRRKDTERRRLLLPCYAKRTMQTARRPEYRVEDTRRPTPDSSRVLKHGRYTKQAKQEGFEWRELVRISRELLHQLKGATPTPCLICWLNSAITTNSLARIGIVLGSGSNAEVLSSYEAQ
jgi:hypothetical protein